MRTYFIYQTKVIVLQSNVNSGIYNFFQHSLRKSLDNVTGNAR
jgi:hypothetical protein